MENRENLIDKIIDVYGYENPITVNFAYMCEIPDVSYDSLEAIVDYLCSNAK